MCLNTGRRIHLAHGFLLSRAGTEMAVWRTSPVTGVVGRGGSSEGRTGTAARIEAAERGKGKEAAISKASVSAISRYLNKGG